MSTVRKQGEMNSGPRPRPMEERHLHLRQVCPHLSPQSRKSLRQAFLELLCPVRCDVTGSRRIASYSAEQFFFPSLSHLFVLTRSTVQAGSHPMILLSQPLIARIIGMYHHAWRFGLLKIWLLGGKCINLETGFKWI